MGEAVNVFFLGKGGVGKSTSAALTSVLLANAGHDVMLVSLDPAHNQSDIFGKHLSDRAARLAPNLQAIEIDQDAWIRRYLKGVRDDIHRTYRYLTSFNLEKYFDVLKYSPGLEEYALLMAFTEIRERYAKRDVFVFDMAPTALSLRFFGLPRLSLTWFHHLRKLREDIIAKRELITRLQLLNREIETDKVLLKIQKSQGEYTALKELFEDGRRTRVHLVLNPDRLSLAESERIVTELRRLQVPIARLIVNKTRPDAPLDLIERAFPDGRRALLPLSAAPLIGIDSLRRYAAESLADETRAALVGLSS
jgi:arsenite-activated ATPase ArsA